MALPWLRILDAVVGLTDIARQVSRRPRSEQLTDTDRRARAATEGPQGALEARLAGVVVAALREVFERDSLRLRVERERLEADRARADRLLRLELARQAGERDVARLRVIAAVAAWCWLGTWIVSAGLAYSGGGHRSARVVLAIGWTLLLGALGASLAGQSRGARALLTDDDRPDGGQAADAAGVAAFWLLLAGLAVSSVAVLL
jgi:hypothetical protein